MKKITLLAAVLAVFTMNAQIFSDDFEDADISDWNQIDEDGDTYVYFAYTGGGTGNYMTSASWLGNGIGALTPNNYSVSPAIDITGSTDLELRYDTGGQDADYSAENYTVYVSTGNTIEDFENEEITVSFSENLGEDPDAAGAFVSRSLDLSSFNGETTLYVAFRHHDVSDQFYLNFDNVVVDVELGVGENTISDFKYFLDSNASLKLSASDIITDIEVYSIVGQKVFTAAVNDAQGSVGLSALSAGIYIVKANTNNSATSFKIIRK